MALYGWYLSVNSPELFFGLFTVRVRIRVRVRVRVGVGVRVNSVTETNIMTEKNNSGELTDKYHMVRSVSYFNGVTANGARNLTPRNYG